MALKFTTVDGTIVIPGAYSTIEVIDEAVGAPVDGVVAIVGEADAGPRFSLETDIDNCAYAPSQVNEVVAKYGSGRLVDAFRAAAVPANDPQIQGAPSLIYVVKTNSSAKATRSLLNIAASAYAVLADKGYGKRGNLIRSVVTTSTAEVVPTTGSFTFIPPVGANTLVFRANGGAAQSISVTAAISPAALVSACSGLTSIAVTGGTDRVAAPLSGNISIAVSGNDVVVTTTVALVATPTAGDTLVIPAASAIVGAGDANAGGYVVTAATSTTISATKLSDAAKPGGVAGTVTAPVAVTPQAVGSSPILVYAPVVATITGSEILGAGRALEIAQTVGTENLAFALNEDEVEWISTVADPQILTSAAERAVSLGLSRSSDGISETITAGGEVLLRIGYQGTTAALTINKTAGTFVVVRAGGSGGDLSLTLADFTTIGDLVEYISAQTGYTAAAGSAVLAQLSPEALDGVSAVACASTNVVMPGRVKSDAFRFFEAITETSVLCQLQDAVGALNIPVAGLPGDTAVGFLAGGTKGATTDADFVAALAAIEAPEVNFVVPQVSRDATADIADLLTESGSTYTIDSVIANTRTHILLTSTFKRRRQRQGLLSKRTTFADAIVASNSLASARCAMTFQDVRLALGGTTRQYQPCVLAALAAGMQAAGGYRNLTAKGINAVSVVQAAGDFDDRNQANVERALLGGLLVAQRLSTGGVAWVSDQTTYGKDTNFVYNSFQVVYSADRLARILRENLEASFKGQSLADVSREDVLAAIDNIMLNVVLPLKLIAASDDAPKGYKDVSVTISGPAALVSLNAKVAGAIYFIPIRLQISQIIQS